MFNSVSSKVHTSVLNKNTDAKSAFVTSPIQKPFVKTQTVNPALAHMNYFLGGQAVSFKGHSCSTSNFRVVKLNDVPCGCCGMPMLTYKQNQQLCLEATQKSGSDLADFLQNNKKYFRGNESAIVNYIISEAQKDEMTDVSSIISHSNVDTHEVFNNENKRVLNNIKASLLSNHCRNNEINSYVDNTIAQLKSEDNVNFRRNNFLSGLNALLNSNGDRELKHQVLDRAVKLPTSEAQIEKFFEKYSNASTTKIMQRLLNPATATAEHIQPHSLKGANNTANYLGECGECNSKRGNYDLNNYWMTNYPNMPESAQKNIDFVTDKIVSGELGDKYDDYPVDLQKALEKQTNGQIKLRVLTPEEIEAKRQESKTEEEKAA
ncbi:hypothetical protein IJ818_04275 [bacterium]|nr:hypothetical protein [bacterium]